MRQNKSIFAAKIHSMSMHQFDYIETPKKLLTPEVVGMLTKIHELKGKQDLYIAAKPDVLSSLLDLAMIQSTKASNKIEGIWTSDERLQAIVQDKTEPHNRSEEVIAGYRDVLATIHESYEYILPRPNVILQLHRDLYSFSSNNVGGQFKNTDNVIAEATLDGTSKARFIPTPAYQTQDAVETLCSEFLKAMEANAIDPLLLIFMFILDFLCIHPFNDGNGRMSRLLTPLLLYHNGYIVGKYISIEMMIEKSKVTYYEALKESSIDWHESRNDYLPFVKYSLGILLKTYAEFENRVGSVFSGKLTKAERIKSIFDQKLGKITKSDIARQCPDISIVTIERTLASLLKEGYIEKYGKSKGSFYTRR